MCSVPATNNRISPWWRAWQRLLTACASLRRRSAFSRVSNLSAYLTPAELVCSHARRMRTTSMVVTLSLQACSGTSSMVTSFHHPPTGGTKRTKASASLYSGACSRSSQTSQTLKTFYLPWRNFWCLHSLRMSSFKTSFEENSACTTDHWYKNWYFCHIIC